MAVMLKYGPKSREARLSTNLAQMICPLLGLTVSAQCERLAANGQCLAPNRYFRNGNELVCTSRAPDCVYKLHQIVRVKLPRQPSLFNQLNLPCLFPSLSNRLWVQPTPSPLFILLLWLSSSQLIVHLVQDLLFVLLIYLCFWKFLALIFLLFVLPLESVAYWKFVAFCLC